MEKISKLLILFDGLFFASILLFIAGLYDAANCILLAGLLYYLYVDLRKNTHGKAYEVFSMIVALLFILVMVFILTDSSIVNNEILNDRIIHKSAWLGIIIVQFSPDFYKKKRQSCPLRTAL